MCIYIYIYIYIYVCGIYLGPEVIIWEPLWALSIYYAATWSLLERGTGFRSEG